MNIDVDFNIVTLEYQSITGGELLIDHHLNLDVYEVDEQGKRWVASAVITREEMLDFLGLNET
jgi:hypothetical protein